MKVLIIIIAIFSITTSLYSQVQIDRPTFNFNPNYQLNSLLNPNQIKMNHSMSFMSGVSSGGLGFYQSSYTNHLRFDLRENLKLNVDLSFVNLGSMSHNNDWKLHSNNDNHNIVVPGFSMEYNPTDNTRFIFEYRQIRGAQPFNTHNRYNEWWR